MKASISACALPALFFGLFSSAASALAFRDAAEPGRSSLQARGFFDALGFTSRSDPIGKPLPVFLQCNEPESGLEFQGCLTRFGQLYRTGMQDVMTPEVCENFLWDAHTRVLRPNSNYYGSCGFVPGTGKDKLKDKFSCGGIFTRRSSYHLRLAKSEDGSFELAARYIPMEKQNYLQAESFGVAQVPATHKVASLLTIPISKKLGSQTWAKGQCRMVFERI
ncbi:MAG: hypothetical protein M1826_002614 [Phylliscum demangeonii]|nr:MAG: hypothetical protein M1826_002614 [Phylliscum demangeonii]